MFFVPMLMKAFPGFPFEHMRAFKNVSELSELRSSEFKKVVESVKVPSIFLVLVKS